MRLAASLSALALLLMSAAPASAQPAGSQIDFPKLIARIQPGQGHELLKALAGEWTVEKSTFVVGGTPERPVRSAGMKTTREWVGDGRFLRDVTQGTMGGRPYFRTGLLGYDNVARRYDWVTADNITPTMMIYQGRPGAGASSPIEMLGTFADLGITGEANVGKPVPMRTVIAIENADRHVLEIYFTPPGGTEILADRAIYTRVK